MELSRRRALLSVGSTVAGGLAGCVRRQVTERRTRIDQSASWSLSPGVDAARDEAAFEAYVEDVRERYGDGGVWGLDSDPGGEFVTAFTYQFAPQTPRPNDAAGPSLEPEPIDADAVSFVQDAAVAIYRREDDRYRYWLWTAADTDKRPGLDLDLVNLTTEVSFPGTELTAGGDVATGDGDASVALPGGPSGRFPLEGGNVDATTVTGENRYFVSWNGNREGAQSINGVCEERRGGNYSFAWNVSVGVEFVREE